VLDGDSASENGCGRPFRGRPGMPRQGRKGRQRAPCGRYRASGERYAGARRGLAAEDSRRPSAVSARRSVARPRRLRVRYERAGRSFYSAAGGMIRIAITPAANDAIAATLPLGSIGYENETNERAEKLIWLNHAVSAGSGPCAGWARMRES
jgi:hypothetical protein